MGLSDPFSTTYQGSFQAGQSLGQGIDSAAGDAANTIQQRKALDLQKAQQQKKIDNMHSTLKAMGILQQDTVEPDVNAYEKALTDNASKIGLDGLQVTGSSDPEERKKQIKSLLDPLGLSPKPTLTAPVFNAERAAKLGMKMDPNTGDMSFEPKEKSMIQQMGLIKEQDKKDNAKAIADAIQNGDQLADFQSLYGLAGPVKAELERRGVNVNKMQLDTIAEKKLAQTLNGPQQTRLRQSIQSVTDGLDVLEGLNQEFKRSGVKAFNKGQIEALANGAGTKEQQDLAQRFVTQITGLQDEFGNVIMSGNAPTDKALELAGRIFKSDYNDTSLSASIKQAKQLLSIRRAAIENVGAAGVSGPIPGQSNQNQGQGVIQAAGLQPQGPQMSLKDGSNQPQVSMANKQIDYKSKYGLK